MFDFMDLFNDACLFSKDVDTFFDDVIKHVKEERLKDKVLSNDMPIAKLKVKKNGESIIDKTYKGEQCIKDMKHDIEKMNNNTSEKQLTTKCNNSLTYADKPSCLVGETAIASTKNDNHIIYDSVGNAYNCLKINDFKVGSIIAPDVKSILYSNDATIVFWADGDKTIVKKMPNEKHDPYAAFCYALAKKTYGSTLKAQEIVKTKSKVQDTNKKKAKSKKHEESK